MMTPIIAAAAKAIMECDEESAWDSIASADCRNAAIAALRVGLPWTPPAEAIETMAREYPSGLLAWEAAAESFRVLIRKDILRIYRAQPIMRELYDESGAPR